MGVRVGVAKFFRKRLLLPVTYFLTSLVYPVTQRVTGIKRLSTSPTPTIIKDQNTERLTGTQLGLS